MRHLSLLILFFISLPSHAQIFNRSELPTTITTPWEILYGPDDFLWLTESGGNISRVDPSNGVKTVIYTAPDYFGGSPLEGNALCTNLSIGAGTLGMTLHPNFTDPSTAFVYFLYSYNSGTAQNPATKFRIKRLTWDPIGNTVIADSNIVDLITTGYDHLGGRLMAVEQNNTPYLFLTIGDNGRSEESSPECYDPQSTNPNNFTQDVNTQNGKIHRFNMDGTVPADNPISGNSFYTRGHRNPQGLMYNPALEILYDIEHGDRTDDEINVLHKGMNYGWKDVRGYHGDGSFPGEDTYVANYVSHPQIADDSLVEPFYAWCNTPDTSSVWTNWCTVAPSGGEYYGSTGIPQWTNSLLVVTLKDGVTTDKEVYQFQLQSNGELVPSTAQNPNPKRFFAADQDINGRLRDIAVSNDGQTVYLINNGGGTDDKITVYQYDTTSSLNQHDSPLNIQLFPNPANDLLSINGLTEYSGLQTIQISSVLGQSIPVEFDSQYNINISGLENGVHFIHLIFEDTTYSLKFLKMN